MFPPGRLEQCSRMVPFLKSSSFRLSSPTALNQYQCSRSAMSDSLRPHGLQHTRLPCPSLTPGAYSDSGPLSWWCHPAISSSVAPFSSCLQSFPASGSFPMSWLFTSGGQSIGASASASVLAMNIQDWFRLGLTVLMFLLYKGLSRVFSSTRVRKHQFFSTHFIFRDFMYHLHLHYK